MLKAGELRRFTPPYPSPEMVAVSLEARAGIEPACADLQSLGHTPMASGIALAGGSLRFVNAPLGSGWPHLGCYVPRISPALVMELEGVE